MSFKEFVETKTEWCSLGPSKIQGHGLIARKKIPKGTCLGMTHKVNENNEWEKLIPVGDYNHSFKPNAIILNKEGYKELVTIEDLDEGDEIVVDYTKQTDLQQPDPLWEMRMPKIISFDFDNTTTLHKWDYDKGDYVRGEDGYPVSFPNPRIIQKMRDHAKIGNKVIIVTSRYDKWKQEIIDFVKEHKLPVQEIHCTNMSWKANKLKKLGASMHYDDDPDELRRLKHKGITGILVYDQNTLDNEVSKNVFGDDK